MYAQFLALKELAQVPELPRARRAEHRHLNHTPPHGARVDPLAQDSKLGLALALKLLLSPDVGEAVVQVADFGGEVLDVLALVLLVDFGFADGDVEVHPHLRSREPPARVVGLEADRVVAGLVRRERKLAFGQPSRIDNLVTALHLLQQREHTVNQRCRLDLSVPRFLSARAS